VRCCYIIVVGWLLTVCVPVSAARHFKFSRLETAARMLGVSDSVRTDTLAYTYYVLYKHQPLKIRQGIRGRVEHIGIPLFNHDYEAAFPSPVFECLEYLTLCQQYHLTENTLPLADIKFFTGSWSVLFGVGDRKTVTLETVKDRYYLVTWQEGRQTIVQLALPVNYELLTCMSRKQLCQDFVCRLNEVASADAPPVDYQHPQQSYYLIPEITPDQNIDSLGCLIFDRSRPQESMANLMLAASHVAPLATLQLELVLDHDRRERLSIPFRRWNALCRSFGCQPYFGLEDSSGETMRGVQIMCNIPTGYDHVLYVECQKDELGKKDIPLKATAYLYVPSSNVKALFASPKKQQSRTKRQNKI